MNNAGQESHTVKISHVRQNTRTSEDRQALRASHWNEHGARNVFLCSVLGTDLEVWIRGQGDWVEGDCQEDGFRDFIVFLSFSCLAVSPSKEESSESRCMKQREAPTIGSG